jgi:hypothetical protein
VILAAKTNSCSQNKGKMTVLADWVKLSSYWLQPILPLKQFLDISYKAFGVEIGDLFLA